MTFVWYRASIASSVYGFRAGSGVEPLAWRAALAPEQPVERRRHDRSRRVKLEIGERGQIPAVDQRRSLALQPDPDPRAREPGDAEADTSEVDGVVHADDPADAALLLEPGQQLADHVDDELAGQTCARRRRPTAGETPMMTSRGSSPGRAGPSGRRSGDAHTACSVARSSTPSAWRIGVDLELACRRRLVAGAGAGVVVRVGDEREHAPSARRIWQLSAGSRRRPARGRAPAPARPPPRTRVSSRAATMSTTDMPASRIVWAAERTARVSVSPRSFDPAASTASSRWASLKSARPRCR